MNSRYLGAVILAPILVFLVIGGSWLQYGLLIVSLIGLNEFYNVVSKKNVNAFRYVGYVFTIFYYAFLYKATFSLIALLIILMVMLLMCIPAINPRYNYIDLSVTILGIIYVSIFFSFVSLVNSKENGNYLVWLIFISSWLSDTAAYYTGRFLGRHKLCPKVSPKKTVEGSIGGLFGSIIGCVVLGIIFQKYGVNIPLFHFGLIGLLSGAFSQFGDLAASSIKRHSEVKDYSHLIPGHGGILDRFDSILFSAVVVFYYLTFVLGR